jgi:short subunit dehydrogenase-like uncharacterized protein
MQAFLKKRIRLGRAGPTEEERRLGRSSFWGEVRSEAGRRVVARLHGGQSYALTVQAALAVVGRVLAGPPAGFQRPATACGPDFVLGLEGMVREDE